MVPARTYGGEATNAGVIDINQIKLIKVINVGDYLSVGTPAAQRQTIPSYSVVASRTVGSRT